MFENSSLKKILSSQYVFVKIYEEVKVFLNSIVEKINRVLLEVKKRFDDMSQEVLKLRDENEVLRRNLENVQNQMKVDYVSLEEYLRRMSMVSQSLKEVQEVNVVILVDYCQGQEEIVLFYVEIKVQKKELDIIQECIKLKYVFFVCLEECECKFKVIEKGLKEQLLEQMYKCCQRDEEVKKGK